MLVKSKGSQKGSLVGWGDLGNCFEKYFDLLSAPLPRVSARITLWSADRVGPAGDTVSDMCSESSSVAMCLNHPSQSSPRYPTGPVTGVGEGLLRLNRLAGGWQCLFS